MRGVNKLVVEVKPEDGYFEKALLFIRPEKINDPQNNISADAVKLLSEISSNTINKKLSKPDPLFFVLAGIAAGSGVSWLIVFAIGLIN